MTDETARTGFAASAEAYLDSAIHARGDDLAAMVAYASEACGGLEDRRVLDVATGAGHTAVAFARAGAIVAAVDLTPEMLAVARTHAEANPRVRPIAFHEGAAEDLPFGDGAFDLVACRIAAHHFERPERFVAEARRVLAPGGRLLLVDNVAPEDPELDEAMNRIERLRDPSHVRAYRVDTWVRWLAGAGLAPERLERFRRTKDVRDWLAQSRTPEPAAAELRAFVLALPEAARAYFGVAADAGEVASLEHEVAFLAARRGP